MESNKSEQGQSPSARAAHHRGQNTYVAPARPAAPTRSAGVPLATSGATIASFFVRPQTTSAARAPQAPTAAREEPATATRATPATASESCAGHRACGPGTARRSSSPGTSVCDPVSRVVACGITPPGNCMEASKSLNCRGFPYHPTCYHTTCGAGGMLLYVYQIFPIVLLSPATRNPPPVIEKAKLK